MFDLGTLRAAPLRLAPGVQRPDDAGASLSPGQGRDRWLSPLAPFFLAALTAASTPAAAAAAGRPPYLPPAAALDTFQLEPGLRIELVAAEPLVIDPVAFAFDDQGRLYVVEARGYPDPIDGRRPASAEGRIALLDDTDGDGRFDRRHEFARDLHYPNGVAIWRNGIFVTDAPDILHLEDTNSDGVADRRRVVLTGFDTSKTTQLRVSHPTLGWDGMIYVAGGRAGGAVSSPLFPARPATPFSTSDGRFDPDTYEYEAVGGQGQFGLTFDAFGRRFTSSNRDPLRHVVLEPWHLARNPHLAVSNVMQDVARSGADAKVYRISQATVTADFMPRLMSTPHAGTFTSACSPLLFGGTALSAEHAGNLFVCESVQNLIQRQVLRPEGTSFRSEPPYTGREFLASRDVWFRPVFLAGGPDGALYVADMHRREIDHPQYVPEEMRGVLDFGGGKGTTGRIYRIRSADKQPSRPPAAEEVAGVVRELESADVWWRERARRVLWERRDPAAVPLLDRVARAAPRPESRAAALWVLRRLGGPAGATLAAALRDPDPRVREQAVLVAEDLPGGAETSRRLFELADDPDPRVRFVTALWLGNREDPRAADALARIALRDGDDPWSRAAVFSGIGSRMPEFLRAVSMAGAETGPAIAPVMEQLGRVLGTGGTMADRWRFVTQMLAGQEGFGWRLRAVLGLAEGLPAAARKRDHKRSLAELFGIETPAGRAALDRFLARAQQLAADDTAEPQIRSAAVALLGYTDLPSLEPIVGRLIDSRVDADLQLQAVRAVERLGHARGAEWLVQPQRWEHYTPQLREAVLGVLCSQPPMIETLFAAIRAGTVAPVDISSLRRGQLLKHAQPAIRKQAEAAFAHLEAGDRMKVYREYRDVLRLPGVPARGAAVFSRVCSACHTYGSRGGKVGPDLTGLRHQPADALLLHILVPNYEVAPDYQLATLTTADGRTLSGSVTAETDSSLTVRMASGNEETILRSVVRSLVTTGASLMPDGLEQSMTRAELADLVAYLKQPPEVP